MREERKRTLREFSYGLCNVLKIMLGVFSTVFVRRQSGEVLITRIHVTFAMMIPEAEFRTPSRRGQSIE